MKNINFVLHACRWTRANVLPGDFRPLSPTGKNGFSLSWSVESETLETTIPKTTYYSLPVISCTFDFGTSAKHIACCTSVDSEPDVPPIFLFLK
jgi:hypothetical protein